MTRIYERKRIHYVRAIYTKNLKPKGYSFQGIVSECLTALPRMIDTEVALPSGEVLAVRVRGTTKDNALQLAVGLAVPNEKMSTQGVKSTALADSNQPEDAPNGRAFKLADAFCLIDGDDILLCMDGAIRVNKVEAFLRGLMGKAGKTAKDQAFELVGRMDQDKAKTLKAEGVKAFRVRGAVYAASTKLSDGADADSGFKQGWRGFISGLRAEFEADLDKKDLDALAEKWAELNIETTISVKGGSNGEPLVLNAIEAAATNIQDEDIPQAEVTIITRKGNEIGADELSIRTAKSMRRLKNQNDLDPYNAWLKLEEFRTELRVTKRWKA